MRTRTLLIIGLAALLGACGSSSKPTPAKPAPPAVGGHTYIATDVQGHHLVPGTTLSLSFTKDRHLGVAAGCNSIGGAYTIKDGTLAVSQLVSTDIGCDAARAAQDAWISRFLSSNPKIVQSGPDLQLSSGATTVRLTDKKIAQPDVPLFGNRWNVETVIVGDTATNTATHAYISFAKDGRFKAFDGCEQVEGTAKPHGDTITFAGKWTILAKCNPGVAVANFGHFLEGTVHYKIDSDQLTLSGPGWGLGLRAVQYAL